MEPKKPLDTLRTYKYQPFIEVLPDENKKLPKNNVWKTYDEWGTSLPVASSQSSSAEAIRPEISLYKILSGGLDPPNFRMNETSLNTAMPSTSTREENSQGSNDKTTHHDLHKPYSATEKSIPEGQKPTPTDRKQEIRPSQEISSCSNPMNKPKALTNKAPETSNQQKHNLHKPNSAAGKSIPEAQKPTPSDRKQEIRPSQETSSWSNPMNKPKAQTKKAPETSNQKKHNLHKPYSDKQKSIPEGQKPIPLSRKQQEIRPSQKTSSPMNKPKAQTNRAPETSNQQKHNLHKPYSDKEKSIPEGQKPIPSSRKQQEIRPSQKTSSPMNQSKAQANKAPKTSNKQKHNLRKPYSDKEKSIPQGQKPSSSGRKQQEIRPSRNTSNAKANKSSFNQHKNEGERERGSELMELEEIPYEILLRLIKTIFNVSRRKRSEDKGPPGPELEEPVQIREYTINYPRKVLRSNSCPPKRVRFESTTLHQAEYIDEEMVSDGRNSHSGKHKRSTGSYDKKKSRGRSEMRSVPSSPQSRVISSQEMSDSPKMVTPKRLKKDDSDRELRRSRHSPERYDRRRGIRSPEHESAPLMDPTFYRRLTNYIRHLEEEAWLRSSNNFQATKPKDETKESRSRRSMDRSKMRSTPSSSRRRTPKDPSPGNSREMPDSPKMFTRKRSRPDDSDRELRHSKHSPERYEIRSVHTSPQRRVPKDPSPGNSRERTDSHKATPKRLKTNDSDRELRHSKHSPERYEIRSTPQSPQRSVPMEPRPSCSKDMSDNPQMDASSRKIDKRGMELSHSRYYPDRYEMRSTPQSPQPSVSVEPRPSSSKDMSDDLQMEGSRRMTDNRDRESRRSRNTPDRHEMRSVPSSPQRRVPMDPRLYSSQEMSNSPKMVTSQRRKTDDRDREYSYQMSMIFNSSQYRHHTEMRTDIRDSVLRHHRYTPDRYEQRSMSNSPQRRVHPREIKPDDREREIENSSYTTDRYGTSECRRHRQEGSRNHSERNTEYDEITRNENQCSSTYMPWRLIPISLGRNNTGYLQRSNVDLQEIPHDTRLNQEIRLYEDERRTISESTSRKKYEDTLEGGEGCTDRTLSNARRQDTSFHNRK